MIATVTKPVLAILILKVLTYISSMSQNDSIDVVSGLIEEFAKERDWDQFHTPKNLVLAVTSEVGELAELLQWKTDLEVIEFAHSSQGRKRLSEEIADVSIYLIRLCQKLDLNFIDILNEKINLNNMKYPIDKSKGSAKKYTDL